MVECFCISNTHLDIFQVPRLCLVPLGLLSELQVDSNPPQLDEKLLVDAVLVDEALDTVTAIQAFYPFVEALARQRGRNPDAPAYLSKVTLTR